MPCIYVIVAVYNGAKTLQTCLDSIDAQSYHRRKLIIMDGGSSDGTVEILKNNTENIDYWESSPDRGIYHAWNKALAHVTEGWVYFLGADDVFHDDYVLENFVKKTRQLNALPLIAYGKIEYCKGDTRRVIGEEWGRIKRKMMSGMYIPHQGVFHHKKVFELCGQFDESNKIAGDYHLLLKSFQYCDPFYLDDFIIADQYAGGISSERAIRWKVLNEFRKVQIKMGIPLTLLWIWEYFKAQLWRLVL